MAKDEVVEVTFIDGGDDYLDLEVIAALKRARAIRKKDKKRLIMKLTKTKKKQ